MNHFLSKYKYILIAAAALVVAGIAAAVWFSQSGESGVAVAAVDMDSEGVAPDTAFWVRLDEGMDPSAIVFEPETAYLLREEEVPNTYILTPTAPLTPGSQIAVKVGGRSFPFQVRNQLIVTGCYPADGARQVPVEAGVELSFNSSAVTPEALTQALQVSPVIQGAFIRQEGRLIYRHDEPFAPDTTYAFTLAAGLADPDGAALREDFTFSFTTGAGQDPKNDFYVSGTGRSINLLPGEVPLFQSYARGFFDSDPAVRVEVKKFDGWQGFQEALRLPEERPLPEEGLTSLAVYDIVPFQPDDRGPTSVYGSSWLIPLPQALEQGWYAVTFAVSNPEAEKEVTRLVQVSDLSVYYLTADDNLVVWVNDTVTGNPVEGASVSFEGDWSASATTDAQGVAGLAELPVAPMARGEWQRSIYNRFTVTAGDRIFVGDSQGSVYINPNYNEAKHKYVSFLFTDRDIYRTTDTVRVWGVVRPRSTEASLPPSVTLTLGDDVIAQTIPLARDGTFETTLELTGMTPGYLSLALSVAEGALDSQYLNIQDFVKPVYTASAQAGQPVWMLDNLHQELHSTVQVTLFDGTPAADFAVRLEPDSSRMEITTPAAQRLTDAGGYLDVALRITEDTNTWYPVEYQFYASGDQALQENFFLYGSVYAIHRDVALTGKPQPGEGEEPDSVLVSTHRVDISGIRESAQLYEPDSLLGQPLSQEVTAEIHRVYYIPTPNGTYYDFMDREWKEKFSYDRQDDVVDIRSFSTQNGSYLLTDLPASDAEGYYYVRLVTQDSQGRTVESETHLGALYGHGWADGVTRYSLGLAGEEGNSLQSGSDYRYSRRRNDFEDSETSVFTLYQNDEPMTQAPGRLLTFVVQDKVKNLAVAANATQVTVPYDEGLIPNYTITGAYFDGERIFALETTPMYYDARQRELEIRLSTDQADYQPGDTMKVTAAVKNKVTGQPAANTVVLLSVVDEAIFAVQDQYVDILGNLYRTVYIPAIHQYTSYNQNLSLSAGEKGGGGGGDSLRDKFADTPCFEAVTTGADGTATLEVTFPDNITSWRMTTAAISPDNHAGNGRQNISVTLDYFVTPVVAPQLLAGDSCAVGLYSAGTGVQSTDPVTYTVTVEGSGVNREQQVSSTVRGYATADLGPLEEGDYTVTVRGSCGERSDAVSLPVSVISSGVEVSLVESFDLARGIDIDPLRYPVSVSFYGENAKVWHQVFRAVAGSAQGARAEARLAARYVASTYAKQEGQWYDADALSADISDLTNRSLSKLPYGAVDNELNVRAVLALPGYFGDYYLQRIYYEYFQYGAEPQNAEGRKSALYLAQATAEPQVYADLEGQMTAANLDLIDQIYYAMALHRSGNESAARAWYGKLVTPNRNTLTGVSGDTALCVTDPAGKVSDLEATAAASLFATMLRTDDAHGLALYLAEKRTEHGEAYLLEMIYYLEQFAPSPGQEAAFAYTRNGEGIDVTLDGLFTPVSFTRAQLEEAGFRVTRGKVYADVYYAGTPAQVTDESARQIGFTKTVEPLSGGAVTSGSLVKITLTPDLSALDTDIGSTQLVIDDYLSSGLRFERYTYAQEEELAAQEPVDPNEPQEPIDPNNPGSDKGWHLISRQGQRLRFCVYGAGSPQGLRPIVYYARCATPGEYVVESAYITSGGVWGASPRSTVTVR